MTTKVKRSLVKCFLNTGTLVSPVWSLIGDGVVSASIGYNPKMLEETYIVDDEASISVESYAPTLPVEATANHTDACFIYLDAMRKLRSIGSACETEIVSVWLYKTPAGGYYLAEKQAVSIQFNEFGGEGGNSAKLSYTINFLGDPIIGAFNPTPTAEFAANPILAGLTSLTLDTAVISPAISNDRLIYTATTTSATDDITATPDHGDAVIVIKANGDTIDNGDPITWDAGLNQVSVEVTVDAEVVTFYLAVTKS
jgi:hypothetical protein